MNVSFIKQIYWKIYYVVTFITLVHKFMKLAMKWFRIAACSNQPIYLYIVDIPYQSAQPKQIYNVFKT